MAKDGKGGRNGRSIVLKKEEIIEGGHHGGAWKVAYADFVTAMMAFFLLMWLLNATTEAQRKGLADYFAPSNEMSRANSGAGMPLGGRTPFDQGDRLSDKGANTVIEGRAPPPPDDDVEGDSATRPGTFADGEAGKPNYASATSNAPPVKDDGKPGGGAAPAESHSQSRAEFLANAGSGAAQAAARQAADPKLAKQTPADEQRAQEQRTQEQRAQEQRAQQQHDRAAFEQAAQQIRDAVARDPSLASLARQLAIDITPEGLRIQMIDEDNQPMFASGSGVLNERARMLVQKIVPALARLDGAISIAGHTDAAPYKGGERSNWELSSERANATRRLLVESGVPETRLRDVVAHADHDLLLPGDPLAAANRRISIVVLRAGAKRAN